MKWRKEQTEPEVPTMSLDEAAAAVADGLDTVRAAVVGYRAKLEADGFSPTMAEQMAAQLHALWVARMFQS